MDSTRPRKLVVCGLIVSPENRVLVAQRPAGKPHPGKWELPGGKIEPGESPEAALERELREELGARVKVGRIWDALFHAYPGFDVLLLIYPCWLMPGEVPRPAEVAEIAWADPRALGSFDLLEADAPIAARLACEPLPLTPSNHKS